MTLTVAFLPQRHKNLSLEYLEVKWPRRVETNVITAPSWQGAAVCYAVLHFFQDQASLQPTPSCVPPPRSYSPGLVWGKAQENEFTEEHWRVHHFILGK